MTRTGFLLGTLALQQFSTLPALPWPGSGFALLALGAIMAGYRLKKPASVSHLLRFSFWLLLGFLWAWGYSSLRLAESLPSAHARYDVEVQGEVLTLPEPFERGIRFDFAIEKTLAPQHISVPERVRLSWYTPPEPVKAGDRWQLHLKLRTPHGSLNPGGMDYEGWLFAEGIRAVGYVTTAGDNRCLQRGEARPWKPAVWRQALHERLSQTLQSSAHAGIIEALVMGVESGISREQWDVLRRTGTTHLVAISGSHIGLIAGLTFFLCRFLAAWIGSKRYSPHQLAAVFSLAVAVGYSALADFAIPTQRALIMIAVVMGALLLRRNASPTRSLSLAALLVSVYDPLACLAPGFWLSFAAVALIVYGTSHRLRIWRGTAALVRINRYTALGLAPLLLLFFQQVSLISPFANLLAIPVLGIILVPICLVGALLLSVQETWGTWLLLCAERLLTGFWFVLEWLAALPDAQWHHPSPSVAAVLLASLGVALLLAPRGIPARWLGLILCLPLVTNRPAPLTPGHFRLTLLDVGQGLSVVVETRQHVLVFDTGARFGPHFDMGMAVVAPYLRYRGIERIDLLMVSHGDNDHIGGADSLLREFRVDAVYSSVPDRLPGTGALPCVRGENRDWDGVRLEMLGPPLIPAIGENDNSCVLKISGNHGSALLTGDIEWRGEAELVQAWGEALASDILVVPHHGSKTSSSALFLDTVKPACALIPDGHLNRYGFPHPDVLHRYINRGTRVFDTAGSGALSTDDAHARSCTIHRYRVEQGRYWNAPATVPGNKENAPSG